MKEKNLVLKGCLFLAFIMSSYSLRKSNYTIKKMFYTEVDKYYLTDDKSKEFEEDRKICDENKYKNVLFRDVWYHNARSNCFLEKIKERKS
jgi:hypothetical protein